MSLITSAISSSVVARAKTIFALMMLLFLASCASNEAREAEIAQQEAAVVEAQREAAVAAEAEENQRIADMRKREEAEQAEAAMLQARRDRVQARREEAARVKAEEERLQAARMEQEQREQQAQRARQQEIVAATAEREAKLTKINELEARIMQSENASSEDERAVMALNEAVTVAEELLDALAYEQSKYEDTDASGNPVEPLAKETLAELEAQKNELVGRARSQ